MLLKVVFCRIRQRRQQTFKILELQFFATFKNHYVLNFVFSSMQNASQNCCHLKVVEEPLGPMGNFTFSGEQVTGLMV